MPCDSSYMEPNDFEINLSRVYQLLDELDGIQLPKNYGTGNDKRVYMRNLPNEILDVKTRELCTRLKHEPDVTKYSLEMQIWWRDHQKADLEREKRNG